MGILRVTTIGLALTGTTAIIVGAALVWSVGVACMVGGALSLAAAILLYDPKAGE